MPDRGEHLIWGWRLIL